MRAIETGFVKMNRWLIGLMMAVMFTLVFVNVVTRYGFGFSIGWAEEISRFLMIWSTFLAIGLALREGRLVAIDVFQDMAGERACKIIRMVIFLSLLSFALGCIFLGFKFVAFVWDMETMVTQMPRGIPYLGIPLGMLFFGVHLGFFARRFIARDWDTGHFGHDVDFDQDGERG